MSLACDCGATELHAIQPGVDPERRGAVDLFTRADPIVDRGQPDKAWCEACWSKRFVRRAA
jgi:hypothetical protein